MPSLNSSFGIGYWILFGFICISFIISIYTYNICRNYNTISSSEEDRKRYSDLVSISFWSTFILAAIIIGFLYLLFNNTASKPNESKQFSGIEESCTDKCFDISQIKVNKE